MVHALADVFLRALQPQLVARPVKARQAVFGHGGPFAVDERDAAMALGMDISHQLFHAAHVIGHDGSAIVEHVVDRHDREPGVYKLENLRIIKIDAGDDHAVDTPVLAVLQIRRRLLADVAVNKRNVVPVRLGFDLEALQNGGKILMRKAASSLVNEQNANIVSTVRFEGPRGGVCHIAEALRRLADQLARLLADIRLAGERLADRRDRNAAGLRDILHRDHAASPPFRPQVFLIVFVISK